MDYKNYSGIDLHIHSTASDGTLSPTEILEKALELKLGAISITDHDTLSGSREVLQRGVPQDIQFVPGVEISTAAIPPFDTSRSYHILGYFIRVDDDDLNQALDRLQHARSERNLKIVQRLNSLGLPITLEEVNREAQAGPAGRPHIAQVLKKQGLVATIDEAFDAYLAEGKPAYVDKFRISCRQGIELIANAGGLPVLAHPGLLKIDALDAAVTFFKTLKDLGLKGIEVFYPEHSEAQIAMLLDLASSHGLLVTGGSDFHGDIKPGIMMGSGDGRLSVPYSLFEKLQAAAAAESGPGKLEQKLGYTFRRPSLLKEALRHSSFVNEQVDANLRDNERFEFLGDAVLNLAVGHLLMKQHPDLAEGELTRIRANLVNEHQLSSIARTLDLGRFMLLGKGETLTGGHEKPSILADALEAVIAAVYLDGGFEASFHLIENHFAELLESPSQNILLQDYKSQLQEFVQSLQKPSPQYRIFDESGPDHDKTFRVRLDVCDRQTIGSGKSKKTAEQDAARHALQLLQPDDPTQN